MRGKPFNKLFAMLVVFVLLLMNLSRVHAAEEEKIKLKVEAGFNSTYKINNTVPIKVEIENNLKNINGELQIEVETSQADFQNNVTIYAQNISLPVNSSKSVTLNVPIVKYITKLTVNIVEGKTTVFTKKVDIAGGLNFEAILIGIMSDNYDSVSYINDIKLQPGRSFTVKNVKLDEKVMPENSEVLKSFDVLIMNDFDSSKLNDAQYAAIKNWVMDGGMLLVGTGPSYSKTLSVFKKDDFISGDIGELSEVTTKELHKVVDDKTSPAFKISALSMNIKDSTQPVKEGSFPLVHRINKGKGAAVVTAFDFGVNPIANWSQKTFFASKLIGNLVPDYYNSQYGIKGMPMGKDPYLVANVVRNLVDMPIPKGRTLAIIFFIYILLAAPINYFILKKLDKREWMWVSVPALAVIFGIVMFIFGFSTRVTEPIANVFTNVTIDKNGNNYSNVYAGIFTPSKKDIKVEGASGVNVKPVPTFNYNYMGTDPNNKPPKVVEAKVLMGQKNAVEFYDNTVFSNKAIAIENGTVKVGKLECSINYSDLAYKGEVFNNTGFDLDEAYIITADNFIKLGAIKNGEKKGINEKGEYYNGFINEFTNKIYKNPYNGPNPQTSFTDEEIKEYRLNEQKRSAINLVFQGDYMKVSEPKIIAFTNSSITKDIVVNGKVVKKYERTLLAAPAELTFKKGNAVEYPRGYIKPKVTANAMKGGYDEMGMRFFGEGTFDLSYDIDKNVKVEKLETSFNFQGGTASDVKLEIYNNISGKYEEAKHSMTIEKEELSKYINESNQLKLKLQILNMNLNAEAPSISVKGSVK